MKFWSINLKGWILGTEDSNFVADFAKSTSDRWTEPTEGKVEKGTEKNEQMIEQISTKKGIQTEIERNMRHKSQAVFETYKEHWKLLQQNKKGRTKEEWNIIDKLKYHPPVCRKFRISKLSIKDYTVKLTDFRENLINTDEGICEKSWKEFSEPYWEGLIPSETPS